MGDARSGGATAGSAWTDSVYFDGPAQLPIVPSHRRLELNLTPPQSRVFHSKARHRVNVTGRRWGKTTEDLVELFSSAASYAGSENWYVGPTKDQAVDIAWEPIMAALEPTGMIRKASNTHHWIELHNRSLIALKSGEAYERMRGKGIGRPVKFVVFDEMRHIPMDAWAKVVRPLLADRKIMEMYGSPGRALFSGTPGGFDEFKTLFDFASITEGWEAFQFTALEGGNILPSEIEQMRLDLSEKDFRQELEASFEALTGLCYHAFLHKLDPIGNLDASLTVRPNLPLLVGMDFNVDPMTCTISQKVQVNGHPECHTFDEIVIKDSNTEEMSKALRDRYPGRTVIVFPDPHSATGRTTKAPVGQTDVSILRRFGFEVYMPASKFYAVRDRYNTVNGMLRNTNGLRRLKIHPKCKTLIRCMDGLTYKEGTNEPNKALGIEHIGDAEGYMIMGAFPPGIYNTSVTELRL